ncbi:ABC transporter substrate-binding protein [Protofrankia coriariae]|uniref:Solute-binding protein family 5 domain-containing protein n=1 Tax=Protofrankia coriariae TaxID=1562887 RepID=A0ABR5F117_9ACTN|nr:ABC transporter substrate-binding protein [Protofrankia coriariae]KLL10420.1 hypothetical protein FrCorBMG51_18195 [Protofrankia coriariae]
MSAAVRSWRRVALVILLGLALAATGAGCGSGDDDTTGTPANGPAVGGTLRWAVYANLGWDPVTSGAAIETPILGLVYDSLIRLDEQGQPTPGLATAWNYSEDGRTLTLKLRDHVTFTDGAAFDAQAVKVNLERGKTQKDSVLVPLLTGIASVDVVDPLTVRLQLTRPDYQLVLVLGGKAGMIVSPTALAGDIARLATTPVGSGAFRLTKFVPDGSSSLVRNPDYWNAANIHLAGVELKYLTDAQVILAGLQSGELDLANITGGGVKAVERAGLKVTQFPSLAASSLLINDSIPPFDNHTLIEAINTAIDRRALIAAQSGGIGEPTFQPFPKGTVGYSEEVANLYPYDPAKARSLLAQAGYPNGITLPPITYVDLIGYKGLTEQLQAQLAAVGIRAELQVLPVTQFADRVVIKHELPFTPAVQLGRESPLQLLVQQYSKDGQLNVGHKASPRLTQLLAEAASYPLDSPQYPGALQAATALAARESAITYLFTRPTVLAHTANVSGLRPYVVFTRLEGVRLAS